MWTSHTTSVPVPSSFSPASFSPASLTNFGAYVRDLYRLRYKHEVAAGSLKPMVIPYTILGTFILPVLYFSIPHVRRPWLHRARYPLMLAILVFNISEALTTSSANFGVAYGVGLMHAWGILWTATLLVWMDPQFEAERIERRKRVGESTTASTATVLLRNGAVRGARACIGHAPTNGHASSNGHAAMNGHRIESVDGAQDIKAFSNIGEKLQCSVLDAPDEDVARSLKEGYEYYWQAYPADAPFATRFGWSLDLVLSMRGTGWNWGVPVLPRFAKAEKPLSGSTVDLSSIPLVSRQGYRRYKTSREWARAQIGTVLLGYLALDMLFVLMIKDPYFVLGPDLTAEMVTKSNFKLPFPIALLPSSVLFVYRGLICFSAILIGIKLIMIVWQLGARFIFGPLLGTRAELWHYPSINGSFTTCVLDKGMVGFWGGFWHQTFRTAFSAPGVWLSRHGYMDPRSAKGRAIAGLVAFSLSGFLHTLGSVTCLPPSKPHLPAVFFLLCWVGILVQTTLTAMLRSAGVGKNSPLWLRRAANFGLTFAWLLATQYLLSDDLARAGMLMLEPVPVSLTRAVGLGRPGDSMWRWDAPLWPRFVMGRTWWESGLAL